MTYQPVVPIGGLAGWRFLQRTLESQRASHAASPTNAREIGYFRDNIAAADTAEKLVGDFQLLKVALGAFGLGDELPKKALIRKILEGGSEAKDAFANRMVDTRYKDFARIFGYGDAGGAQVGREGFADEIVERYRIRSFEEAVGAVDADMRLALNFQRSASELASLAAGGMKTDVAWMRVLGDKPLREVFDKALGLPEGFPALDIDRQLEIYKDKVGRLLGSSDPARLGEADAKETVLRRFFVRQELENGSGGFTPALTLLQSSQNLFLSRL